MTDRPPTDRAGPTRSLAAVTSYAGAPPAGLLAELTLRITDWRKRARYARTFRGLDRRQLRDLGLNPLDQW